MKQDLRAANSENFKKMRLIYAKKVRNTPKKAVGGVDSPKKEKVSGKSDGRERKSPCSAGTGGVETA